MSVYVITNGTKYIKQNVGGDYTATTNFSLAETYKSKRLASSVLNNALSYALKNTYYVAEFVNNKIIPCSISLSEKLEQRKDTPSFYFKNGVENMEWSKKFIALRGVFDDAMSRGYELSKEIGEVDAEIVDLEHYIEFTPLNARDGFKIYRKLRDLLRKRRNLKNEQTIVNSINYNHSVKNNISNIINTINECANREYKPRVLLNLFKNGIKALDEIEGGE